MSAQIVVVEDDDTIALGLVTGLEHSGFNVRRFDNAEDGIESIMQTVPDLVLLDIMLPGMDGIEALGKIRADHKTLPVILLTAKGEEEDRVQGLESGADDYVTKPFSVRELIARINARLRIVEDKEPDIPDTYAFADVSVDLKRRVLTKAGEEHRLTTHEAGVLGYLIGRKGRDVTREELLEKVWGYSPNMVTRTVDNQILKLRKKIEDTPADPRHILTIHGSGYRFED